MQARGLLASVGERWPWTNIDSGEREDGGEPLVAQVLGDASRDQVMLELHADGVYWVVGRRQIGDDAHDWHYFSAPASRVMPSCRRDEALPTAVMLDMAITWLQTGTLLDPAYELRPAHRAFRLEDQG